MRIRPPVFLLKMWWQSSAPLLIRWFKFGSLLLQGCFLVHQLCLFKSQSCSESLQSCRQFSLFYVKMVTFCSSIYNPEINHQCSVKVKWVLSSGLDCTQCSLSGASWYSTNAPTSDLDHSVRQQELQVFWQFDAVINHHLLFSLDMAQHNFLLFHKIKDSLFSLTKRNPVCITDINDHVKTSRIF